VLRKTVPNMAKNTRVMATLAALNLGSSKKLRRSIGCSV